MTSLPNYLNAIYNLNPVIENWPNLIGNIGQFLYVLLMVVIVCALAYYTTRLLGSAKFGRRGRNLELIETLGVGTQTFIHIIKSGEKYVLIGVTRNQVTFLKELDADDLTFPDVAQTTGFESLLSRFRQFPPEDIIDRNGWEDRDGDRNDKEVENNRDVDNDGEEKSP